MEIKDPEKPVFIKNPKGNIEFKDVTFIYNESKNKAIKNINLNIKEGESIAFVGRSGSGKTTLIKLLMRFFDPQIGEIKIDGKNIKSLTKSHLRSFMGVVPQEPILFDNTIGYNIAYGTKKASLVEIGSHKELTKKDSLYRHFWHLQTKVD